MALLTTIAGVVKLVDLLGIDDWFGGLVGGEPGQAVASKVMDVAKVVTGSANPEEIIRQVENSAGLRLDLKRTLLSHSHELKLAALDDKKSARQMYQATDHSMADKIADRIIKLNPIYIGALVAAYLLLLHFVADKTIAMAGSALIGGSITYLWQERQAVVNFFFGSSLGSKDKARQLASKK